MLSRDDKKSGLSMGGSLGTLPTENLLQMIGNLRLSTRLLLEEPDTKDFSLLTFREGGLVPEIESSHFPSLRETLAIDPEVNKGILKNVDEGSAEAPLWNRVLGAGIADRKKLKKYLTDGIRVTLTKFSNLSGVHFELSPIPADRLGNLAGFSVTEICALSRKPALIPEPGEKTMDKPAKTTPYQQTSSGPHQMLTDLMIKLKDSVPGALACYTLDVKARRSLASSSTLMLDDKPVFHVIVDRIYDLFAPRPQPSLDFHEAYLMIDEYLIGVSFLGNNTCLITICRQQTSLGLLLTSLRKAKRRALELISGDNR